MSCEKRRPAISRRVDTCVLDECSVGSEAVDLLLPPDAWSVERWAAPVVPDWTPATRLEARMRGSVLNDVADAILLGCVGDDPVREAWGRRHDDEVRCRRCDDTPRTAASLTDSECAWLWTLASSAAAKIASWGPVLSIQERLWTPASTCPDCKGGIEDYRVRSRRTGREMLIDLKLLKDSMFDGDGARRWPKDEIYAVSYLVSSAIRGEAAGGCAVLDVRHGQLVLLTTDSLMSVDDGLPRRVAERVFGASPATCDLVVERLSATRL